MLMFPSPKNPCTDMFTSADFLLDGLMKNAIIRLMFTREMEKRIYGRYAVMIINKFFDKLKDGKTYGFRSLDSSDAQTMYDLRVQTAGETDFLARFPEEFPQTCDEERKSISLAAESANDLFLGAYDGDKLIGSAHVFPVSKYKKFAHRCEIGILIAKDYWSCGVGKKLMLDCMDIAGKMGYKMMQLGTFAQNKRGIGLYEHLGFKKAGIIPNAALRTDGSYYDEEIMYKELQEESSLYNYHC